MSETTSGDLPFSDDEAEPTDIPLADPDAVAEADQDDGADAGDRDHSNLAPDDPNRTW